MGCMSPAHRVFGIDGCLLRQQGLLRRGGRGLNLQQKSGHSSPSVGRNVSVARAVSHLADGVEQLGLV